ncbi:MAG: phosphopyruvate hydratase [Ruminococcaceae bacterium]|nr:phosphopyruvate hydratase [Oscillospiraceae bacterium]
MQKTKIEKIKAIQILDSRGNPTIETTVMLTCGATGKAQVPSGASTGKFEAYEKRDGEDAYLGKGVIDACRCVNTEINDLLKNKNAEDQFEIDLLMCRHDGTENKSRLGANAILSVSIAAAKAVSNAYGIPLYRYLGGKNARTLPIPLLNIINGGAHADNGLDIQEFMICPVGAKSFTGAMRMSMEIYGNLKSILREDELSISVGDEGGFAPQFQDAEEALQYIVRAIEFAGYKPGKDVFIALDIAASEWQNNDGYLLPKSKKEYSTQDLIDYYKALIQKYPIISIEDPLHEEDFEGFSAIRQQTGIQIVGDDLFVTNPKRLKIGIEKRAANAILVKPNQIGTLSETLTAIEMAKSAGMSAILSHRSGDTPDTAIADIAVATNCNQIKSGAPARGERIAKYNRLIAIENEIGSGGIYGNLLH